MTTADLIRHDTDCTLCGVRAEHRTCADCGVEGIVTDCGCKAQPRPIAGSESNGEPVCGECEDARRREAVR